ncbi:MAG: HD-GYP domain-containing protein [Firmicutes bacterium]|nr:HD-GYP domain-containing protein [Bacillota bacterium]
MRRLPIENAKPGMVNASNIYSASGQNLLAKGLVLNEFYIEKLKTMGINSLYVQTGIADDVVPPEIISEERRVEMVRTVNQVYASLESNRGLNTRTIQLLVSRVLDDIMSNPEVMIHLIDIRAYDDYTFNHSINVCLISLMVGVTLGYTQPQLRELGIGALLHDVGRTKIPYEVFNKPGPLTPEEYDEVKRHTVYGFEILRKYFELSLLSSHVAYQHHERCDGSGYPRGLTGKEIHEYSRIVAVVDVYDAMLADRAYRPAVTSFQALNEIKRLAGENRLDPGVVAALVKNIAVYPVGSIVQLSNGDIGVVLAVSKRAQDRPLVRRILDSTGGMLKDDSQIDLAANPDLRIDQVFEDEETYSNIRKMIK